MRYFILLAMACYAASADSAGNAANGKKIFDTYGCYQCHDHDAKGGAGARLAPKPIPFARSPLRAQPQRRNAALHERGRTDQELADIYAYLQSIPKPPDVKTIPALNH